MPHSFSDEVAAAEDQISSIDTLLYYSFIKLLEPLTFHVWDDADLWEPHSNERHELGDIHYMYYVAVAQRRVVQDLDDELAAPQCRINKWLRLSSSAGKIDQLHNPLMMCNEPVIERC